MYSFGSSCPLNDRTEIILENDLDALDVDNCVSDDGDGVGNERHVELKAARDEADNREDTDLNIE
jgi:hypothetical protein